jgi:mannose-6-phosphate isomerase-like protein (cupin superfamily)
MISERVSSLCSFFKKIEKKDYLFKHFSNVFDTYITKKEIQDILTNNILIEKDSFKIVRNGFYQNKDNSIRKNDPSYEIPRIKESLKDNCTIVVKNLEMYNEEIHNICSSIGSSVDAHMYISNMGSNGFPLHDDDRSVFITMLYGEKIFYIDSNNKLEEIIVKSGDVLFIKQGVKHKAIASEASCHISYGCADLFYNTYGHSYPIPIDLPF